MRVDKKATSYEWGNGRFDLMTTDEACSLSSGEIETILSRLADAMRQGESSIGQEVYHHWLELHLRYPDADFRLEVVSQSQEKE